MDKVFKIFHMHGFQIFCAKINVINVSSNFIFHKFLEYPLTVVTVNYSFLKSRKCVPKINFSS